MIHLAAALLLLPVRSLRPRSTPKKKVAPQNFPGAKAPAGTKAARAMAPADATVSPVLSRREIRALWREYHLDPDLSDADRATATEWISSLARRSGAPLPTVVA